MAGTSPAVATFRSLRKRVLPVAASRRRARRIGRLEIAEQHRAVLLVQRRHVVLADHQVDGVLPPRARQTLLRYQLEAMAGRAGVKGLIAAGSGDELLRAF